MELENVVLIFVDGSYSRFLAHQLDFSLGMQPKACGSILYTI